MMSRGIGMVVRRLGYAFTFPSGAAPRGRRTGTGKPSPPQRLPAFMTALHGASAGLYTTEAFRHPFSHRGCPSPCGSPEPPPAEPSPSARLRPLRTPARGFPQRRKKRRENLPQEAFSLPVAPAIEQTQQFLLQWNSSSIQYSSGMAFLRFSMRAFSCSASIGWRRM